MSSLATSSAASASAAVFRTLEEYLNASKPRLTTAEDIGNLMKAKELSGHGVEAIASALQKLRPDLVDQTKDFMKKYAPARTQPPTQQALAASHGPSATETSQPAASSPPSLSAADLQAVATLQSASSGEALIQASGEIDWAEDPLYLKAWRDSATAVECTFKKTVSDEDARAVETGITEQVAPRVDEWTKQGKKVLVVLTVGASNGSANRTNPSHGPYVTESNMQAQRLPKYLQSDAGNFDEVIHVRVDEGDTKVEKQGRITTCDISGAFPLNAVAIKPAHPTAEYTAVQALIKTAKQAVASGGGFVIQNFITRQPYPGLIDVLLSVRDRKREERPDDGVCTTAYVNQYLETSTAVSVFAPMGLGVFVGKAASLAKLGSPASLLRRRDLTGTGTPESPAATART